MALYKYSEHLEQTNDRLFDNSFSPGDKIPFSGIYRCEKCGLEITSNKDNPLPPQNHHQHTPVQGPIIWKLLIATG